MMGVYKKIIKIQGLLYRLDTERIQMWYEVQSISETEHSLYNANGIHGHISTERERMEQKKKTHLILCIVNFIDHIKNIFLWKFHYDLLSVGWVYLASMINKVNRPVFIQDILNKFSFFLWGGVDATFMWGWRNLFFRRVHETFIGSGAVWIFYLRVIEEGIKTDSAEY